MAKLRQWFLGLDNIGMKRKLVVSYILIVMLPVLLVGLILTRGMSRMAFTQAMNSSKADVERTVKRMTEVCSLATEVSDKIYLTPNLMAMLTKNYQSAYDIFVDYTSNPELDIYLNLNSGEIEDIRLYTVNKTLLNNSRFIPLEEEAMAYPWMKKAMAGNGRIYWNYSRNEQKNQSFLSMTRLIRGTGMTPLGVLAIDISVDFFDSLLFNQQYETIIVDDENTIIAIKDKALTGQKLSVLKLDSGMALDSAEGTDALICLEDIAYKGKSSVAIIQSFSPDYSDSVLKVISIFETSAIMSEVKGTVLLGAGIITASFLLSLILVVLFSDLLSRRLKQLSKDIHIITTGNFDMEVTVKGDDEIGRVAEDLQFMTRSIKELMHQVYEVNLQKKQLVIQQKEIRLRMLSNQMNPHFLFNVLEVVRSKANALGADEIVGIVKQLGKLLRGSLEMESESIPLTKELDLVKSYLEIQKYRYKERLAYELKVWDPIEDYKIMPFIIQPLVENAVVHGLEKKLGGGGIGIEIHFTETLLSITVTDDGTGMSEERLNRVRMSFDEWEGHPEARIGLRNVCQRIKLHYGEPYGLTLESGEAWGTRVIVLLPGRGCWNAEGHDCG